MLTIHYGERIVSKKWGKWISKQENEKEQNWTFILCHNENQLKCINNLHVRPEAVKFLEENFMTLIMAMISWTLKS